MLIQTAAAFYLVQNWGKLLRCYPCFFFKYGISKVRLYPGEEKFCHQNGVLIARALFKLHCNSFSNIYFVGLRK